MKTSLFFILLFVSSITYSQTESICPDQSIPRGWVVIDKTTCAGCCGMSGELVYRLTIKRIDQTPVGQTESICPNQSIPRGWVVIDKTTCAGCCGMPGELVYRLTIKRIDQTPVGHNRKHLPQSIHTERMGGHG
jgi:hypothetical protein